MDGEADVAAEAVTTGTAAANDPFAVDSEVATDLRRVDWSTTPLGAVDTWPSSLRTVVRALLSSRFSMWMAWGPELTFFCNGAYRRDTLGRKYPWALGRPASEVWAEIWPDIGPRIDTVMRTGRATWDEALLLFLERSGFVEESYHTFSYSPLTDDDGRVVGMLCVVTEDTDQVIAERRMALLRDLGSQSRALPDEAGYFAEACRHLAGSSRELPFTLTYLYDEPSTGPDGPRPRTAHLVGATGAAPGDPVAPPMLDLTDPGIPWPATELLAGVTTVVPLDPDRYGALPTGAWPEPPQQAIVAPLPQQGQQVPFGFLVVGANRYRPLDDGYRDFVGLVAGQLGAGLGGTRAYEAERRRADQLAELDRAKTAFFTNISHEFRTPLTLMLGPAEDALDDTAQPLTGVQRDRVETVHRNGQRLLRLVNSLLDFSRLESGRLTARFVPVDLGRETADLASTFRAAIERVGLTLTVDSPASGTVHVDPEMWAKIVLNLLSNALKFTFEGGITVRTRAVGDKVEVSVADTGTGIAEPDRPALFQRFHRITGARSRTYEGSGIGLALVAELVALHGGEVDVESEPGRGSTFVVRLPYGVEHLPPEQVADDPSEPADAGHAAETGRQVADGFLAEAMRWAGDPPVPGGFVGSADADAPLVLVADDNADMRDYVARLLGDRYRVAVARDGAEALDLALAEPPDLVLTDVMMPRLDGFGLLSALHENEATRLVPVVMLSARAGDDAAVEGLEAGADDYLVKPFTARELLARVGANLELERVRRTRVRLERNQELFDRAERMARVGSWELDPVTGAITASDELARQLHLSHAELAELGLEHVLTTLVPDDDAAVARAAVAAALETGAPLDFRFRVNEPGGATRTYRVIGETRRDATGAVRLTGSNQDVTELLAAQDSMASAAALQEAAVREHQIADELQRSLLPSSEHRSDHLQVATFYRAGVEGTQVGGDWYDVIELGAGRTALVVGDVMGRGVPAAAVMGQLRTAVRAYARLDMPPADILEFLDGVVRDLAHDQIVTCVYAVYDPGDGSLTWASAGHLPPLLLTADGDVERLGGVAGPPLGTGLLALSDNRLPLPTGAGLALYTDGLVESRHSDIDDGIDLLRRTLLDLDVPFAMLPGAVVSAMLPTEPSDDVALLVARAQAPQSPSAVAVVEVTPAQDAVAEVRRTVVATLREWCVTGTAADHVELLTSELVTNAILHGRPPIRLRLRLGEGHVVLEVHDSATYLPRRQRPTPTDEHGRGLQLVTLLADRWGTRATPEGKAVWCVVRTDGR